MQLLFFLVPVNDGAHSTCKGRLVVTQPPYWAGTQSNQGQFDGWAHDHRVWWWWCGRTAGSQGKGDARTHALSSACICVFLGRAGWLGLRRPQVIGRAFRAGGASPTTSRVIFPFCVCCVPIHRPHLDNARGRENAKLEGILAVPCHTAPLSSLTVSPRVLEGHCGDVKSPSANS